MKYLVLGSEGQIGKALVAFLQKNNHEVLTFDIASSPNEDLRISKNPLLESRIQESDFVFFLAFDVGGSRYLKTYQHTYDFISNNTKIMDVTFDLLHTHKKPFIFASSQMSTMSFSSYGRSKALGESYTKILNGLTVKFWNVYGIEYDLEKSHVITDLIIKAKKTGKVDLLTDGTEERQFLYADDCCEALLTLSENYEVIPRDEELHVTSFEWNNVLTVAKIISDHFPGSEVVPAESAKDEVQKDVKNEPNTIIQKYWQPKTSLEEGISRVIEEMNKHPELFFK
jgi:nucleoside-diphosphate-sugar epimerase